MPTWSSVWHKKGLSFNLKLPTELWAMIIDLVLVGVRHPFLFCEPETFPQYQVLLWNVDTSNKIPFLEDWKRVRAVCEEWKRLAGVKPYVFLKGLGPDIPNATSSVFIHCLENPRLSMERITHLKENLTTLALGFSTPAGNDATDILLDNPSMFPNLKCLSVGSSRTKRSFWKVIQDKFPNLISLTVRLDVYELVCPSLKHLHLYAASSVAVHEFIMEHGHQLESFIGPIPRLIETRQDVWSSTFPNIVAFGCRMRMGPRRAVPPPYHPLRHLRLTSDHNSLRPEQVIAEIDAYGFPGLESVQINLNDMRRGTANDLRTRCRKRGVRLVEIFDGRTVAVSPPRPIMAYVTTAFFMCTLPCWWFCIDKDEWR